MTESTSAVEQAVQARIAAVRARCDSNRQRRRELAEARRRGLEARYAQKLRNLAERQEGDHQK